MANEQGQPADQAKRSFVLRWRSAVVNSQEPASVKLTLLALAENADADGSNCFPGMDLLASQTSQNEKTCRRALDAANRRWFNRTPVKFAGRQWKGYSYHLLIPEDADTMSGTRREVAGTVSVTQGSSSGQSVPEFRTLTPEVAGTVSDDLGKALRKSTKVGAIAAEAAVAKTSKAGSRKSRGMTFAEWEQSKGEGEMLIEATHHVFDYIDRIGLPQDFVDLAWYAFGDRYREDGNARYIDWPTHFRKSIEGNWYKIWWIAEDGAFYLTTKGKQAAIAHGISINQLVQDNRQLL